MAFTSQPEHGELQLALQFFDMVIGVKENVGKAGIPRAGVYVSDGPEGFLSLDHTIEARWSSKGERHISKLSFGELDAPEARRKAASEHG